MSTIVDDMRTFSVPPERTREQQLEALVLANGVRYERADLKRRIRSRDLTITEVMINTPPCMDRIRIEELLLCLRRVGEVKVLYLLRGLGVSPGKRLERLTDRQKDVILDWLNGR